MLSTSAPVPGPCCQENQGADRITTRPDKSTASADLHADQEVSQKHILRHIKPNISLGCDSQSQLQE